MQKTDELIDVSIEDELAKNINSILMSEELQDIVDFHEEDVNTDNFSIILNFEDAVINSPVLFYKKTNKKTIIDILIDKKDITGLILESFRYIKILFNDKELIFLNLKKNIVTYRIKLFDKNIYKVRFFIKKEGSNEF